MTDFELRIFHATAELEAVSRAAKEHANALIALLAERDAAVSALEAEREKVAGLTKKLSAAYVANIGEHGAECAEQNKLLAEALEAERATSLSRASSD